MAIRIGLWIPALAVAGLAVPVAAAQNREEPTKLAEKQEERRTDGMRGPFKRWLDEDVPYIITPEEWKAFVQMATDEERENFIESFWMRRDPTPGSTENEYKEEHYRRIAWANDRYASDTPGWRTERGRIYIAYGPPDEIESHPSGGQYRRPGEEGGGFNSAYPFEIWRYRWVEGVGRDILLKFVDPTMTGEYQLTMDPSE